MALNWGAFDADVVKEIKSEYERYGKFGDDSFHGDNITLRNLDKWLTEAGIIGENQKVSTNDTSIAFKRILSNEQKTMPFDKFKDFISDLSQTANPANSGEVLKDWIGKLRKGSGPKMNDTTKTDKADVVDRLTDPAGYTGTQRFAADGKAVDGKDIKDQDQTSNDGYVQGYKNKDTYDKDNDVKQSPYDAESQRKRDDAAKSTSPGTDPKNAPTVNELKKSPSASNQNKNDSSNQNKNDSSNQNKNADINRQMAEPSRTETVGRSQPDKNSHAVDHNSSNPRANKTDLKEAEASREGYQNAGQAQDDRAKNQNQRDVGQIKRDARPTPANESQGKDGTYQQGQRSDDVSRNVNQQVKRTENDQSTGGREVRQEERSERREERREERRDERYDEKGGRDVTGQSVRDQVDKLNKNNTGQGAPRDPKENNASQLREATAPNNNLGKSPSRDNNLGKSPSRGNVADSRSPARTDNASDRLAGTDRNTSQNTPGEQRNPAFMSQDKAYAATQQRDSKSPQGRNNDGQNTSNQSDAEKLSNTHTMHGHVTSSTVPGNAGQTDNQRTADSHGHHTTQGRIENQSGHRHENAAATQRTDSNRHRAEVDARDADLPADTATADNRSANYTTQNSSGQSNPTADTNASRNADIITSSSTRSGAPYAKDNARIAHEQVAAVSNPPGQQTTQQKDTSGKK